MSTTTKIDDYRKMQKKWADAKSYKERIEALPSWDKMPVQLIEFGPKPGEKNIGFKTSFVRFQRPKVDLAKCKGDLICWLLCPIGARIKKDIMQKKEGVDWDYCQGCGICAEVCPQKAITMVSEIEFKTGMKEDEVPVWEVMEFGY